jgi:hypothetical protein
MLKILFKRVYAKRRVSFLHTLSAMSGTSACFLGRSERVSQNCRAESGAIEKNNKKAGFLFAYTLSNEYS